MCRTQVYLRCVDSLKFRKWVSFLSHSDNKARWSDKFRRAFFLQYGKSGNFDPKTGKRLRPDGWNFQPPGRFLWINFAELAGKNRSGQRSQLALTSTSTLLFGTTICSCLVGMGGFLYWRRAFWICCLTSSRAASSVGAWVVILGKSETWAVQPSAESVQSTG